MEGENEGKRMIGRGKKIDTRQMKYIRIAITEGK